ncbi:MAG: hypothetical protein A2847_02205 [Candidatus Sungbacteria bacterium RIFCSPHIGHO2_01_FULL_50_25]|uniref:Uncharacterized protein n=1 Tax=Candidatus Sungbacteria bacterium RIFCSPHIGHO2_01_FULL_50_25 TaxID=1802265 RepID=A0A1G2K6F9_9BACT|nr:MAG: hypothetical protein A2847_02205 [Candidatus Sungbacteria bacterium RIFCSPHIGHO2_01_FULL_50_25]
MGFEAISCLMVQNVSLTNSMRNTLIFGAIELLRYHGEKGNGRKRIKTDDIEGFITTEFEPSYLGSITGIVFHADIDTELGRGKVRFLMDPRYAALDPEDILRRPWTDVTENFQKASRAHLN